MIFICFNSCYTAIYIHIVIETRFANSELCRLLTECSQKSTFLKNDLDFNILILYAKLVVSDLFHVLYNFRVFENILFDSDNVVNFIEMTWGDANK